MGKEHLQHSNVLNSLRDFKNYTKAIWNMISLIKPQVKLIASLITTDHKKNTGNAEMVMIFCIILKTYQISSIDKNLNSNVL